jgi:predicted nucleic acid-binding protein
VLSPLIEAGAVATCGVIEFELGWAARSSAESGQLRIDRDAGYEWLAIHDEDWRRALDVQAALWRRGRMRAVGFPDLLIAAVVERERATLLHFAGAHQPSRRQTHSTRQKMRTVLADVRHGGGPVGRWGGSVLGRAGGAAGMRAAAPP